MRTSKKIARAIICFVICLVLLSAILIVPFLRSENAITRGRKLRAQLAGELDFLVSGASHALTSFDPKIIDNKLNCNSYNISNTLMSSYGRKTMIEKELGRNEIDTVVIELSFNALSTDQSGAAGEGDQVTLARLDTFGERMDYMLKYIPIDEWVNIYARDLEGGVMYWLALLLGKQEQEVADEHKGYMSRETNDCALSAEDAVLKYNEKMIDSPEDYLQESIEDLKESIELCKAKNTEVIIAVTPLADSFIWSHEGWDVFLQWAKAFAEKNGCDFYDFNLLKNRYELFSDTESFYDGMHMSATGSEVFSNAFCDIIIKAESGEDVSAYFFESYQEMKKLSPYAAYLP